MKHILPLNNTKQIFFLTLKYTLFVSKLTILILLSIAHLFAAEEERKGPDAKYSVRKYDDALTQELIVFCQTITNHEWRNQRTIERIQTLIRAGANPNGYPILHFASQINSIPLIETCLTYGANKNAAIESLLNALPEDKRKVKGKKTLCDASMSDTMPPEMINAFCMHTPPEFADDETTPLHYLCATADTKEVQDFFLKATVLLWWSLKQLDIREKNNTIPRDLLKLARHLPLLETFDTIVYDVQCAQNQLSPIPPMSFTPPMSLKEFDQHREFLEKEQLKKCISEKLPFFITKNISTANHTNRIIDTILSYAGRNTPHPTYPTLAFREKKNKKTYTTKYDIEQTKKLNKLCNTAPHPWNQEVTNQIQTLIRNKANPDARLPFSVFSIACFDNNIPPHANLYRSWRTSKSSNPKIR